MLSGTDRAIALEALAEGLSAIEGSWWVEGDLVRSRGPALVRVNNTCDMADVPGELVHLDVELATAAERPDSVVYDCSTGFEVPRERAVRQAVESWLVTTAPALLTFLASGRCVGGAEHLNSGDPGGVPGWHCIVGPDVAVGFDADDTERLFDFLASTSPLGRVAPAVARRPLRPYLNGVRLFRGGPGADSSEVRVNGVRDDEASAALAALPWPEARELCVFRKFALLVAPE